MLFGKKIRELRDENGVLQRQLAALLEIDTPMFSKIERGDRRAKREQVKKLAEDAKVAMRNSRRDAMDALKKVKNDKLVSEDSIKNFEEEVDKILAKNIEEVDNTCKVKEKEVMSV